MKLVGSVQVLNRRHADSRGRAQWSVLVLSKPVRSASREGICIWLQTRKNLPGTKYQVYGNIHDIFSKFANEGKATIRFITPPHDVIINSSVVELNNFLKLIRRCLDPTMPERCIKFSMPTKKIPEKNKTELKILKKSEYPVNGFPRYLQVLEVISVDRNQFDPRILCLENLTTLNLTHNNLQKIPEELNFLTKLSVLVLARNCLGKGTQADWSWLNGRSLAQSLKKLDLSYNELKLVPNQIAKLRALTSLDLSFNMLEQLPPGLGKLVNLRVLNVSSNQLTYFPSSARMLKLEELDVTQNTWKHTEFAFIVRQHVAFTSLLDCTARVIINKRIPYSPQEVPYNISHYLDGAKYCACRSACFNDSLECFSAFNLMDISSSVIHNVGRSYLVPIKKAFCSMKCYFKDRTNDHDFIHASRNYVMLLKRKPVGT